MELPPFLHSNGRPGRLLITLSLCASRCSHERANSPTSFATDSAVLAGMRRFAKY